MALIRIYNKDTGNFDIYFNSNDIPNLENYYTKNEIDSLLNDKSDHDHTHIISNVDGLQTALNGKLGTGETAYNSTRWNGYQLRFGSGLSGASGYITFTY
jgi:hypothetical protein